MYGVAGRTSAQIVLAEAFLATFLPGLRARRRAAPRRADARGRRVRRALTPEGGPAGDHLRDGARRIRAQGLRRRSGRLSVEALRPAPVQRGAAPRAQTDRERSAPPPEGLDGRP